VLELVMTRDFEGGGLMRELEWLEGEIRAAMPEALAGDIQAAWRVLDLLDERADLLGLTDGKRERAARPPDC
jgi:hypothetical protein